MFKRCIWSIVMLACAMTLSLSGTARAARMTASCASRARIPCPKPSSASKMDVADKGIMFFNEIDQSKLAADAGVTLRPSTLIVFGNPPLGTLFLTSNPDRLGSIGPCDFLVYQDEKGDVWVNYTDFTWIAHRHGIMDRDEAFKKASEVIASITSTVQ